jgi:hypothetical protein
VVEHVVRHRQLVVARGAIVALVTGLVLLAGLAVVSIET